LIYTKNIGPYLSLDETALSNGELYTIITNKSKKGKKGSIVAMLKGTAAGEIIEILKNKLTLKQRNTVKEITLDMAGSMNEIARECFRKATRVTDRFHVQKLAFAAVQDIRIKYRWEVLEMENQEYLAARKNNQRHTPKVLPNGDTYKQLLARSRYLLFKPRNKWTLKQVSRAEILFELYPDLCQAYKLAMDLNSIYQHSSNKTIAITRLAHWFRKVEQSGFKNFASVMRSFQIHYDSIANFFINRSTNASAESFNAKIKDFRRNFRGVTDVKFFLFRLTKIYA
jgi:transposase